MATLRLILADQLTVTLPLIAAAAPEDTLLLVEVMEEASYVPHHPQKITFLFSAMRHFAEELRQAGKRVRYVKLDDPANTGSFDGEVARAVQELGATHVVVTEPGEWRVLQKFQAWPNTLGVPVEILPDLRFLSTREDFATHAKGRKQLRMEFFYRELRQRTGILMENNGKPVGGKWNYDTENRGAYDGAVPPPVIPCSAPDAMTQEVLALVERKFGQHFGRLAGFRYGVTRTEALAHLHHFLQHRLPYFGQYQDAMVQGQPYLFHSLISMYLNCGLLVAEEVCRAAEATYYAGHAPLPAVEGFIRQILGWREYVRGVYWHQMPDYATRNFLGATQPLPPWFWSGETKMNCLHHAITETRDNAYAHHIQRLMVIGNFALLAGLDVQEVCQWYLAVYTDAYEWVELPNTLGMALYGDGGAEGGGMASKPYAASGAYIHKMSNYCSSCHYDVNLKEGARACPYNRLYWGFLIQHEAKLRGNMRMVYPYATLGKFSPERREKLAAEARVVIDHLATL
jgi:deoxyribodipyrimidine photolyase-related protein